jgi:hypothetical protein
MVAYLRYSHIIIIWIKGGSAERELSVPLLFKYFGKIS